MVAVNKCIVAGNLTRTPEIKYTQSGLAIAEVGLAINEKRKDASGNYVEDVTFVDLTAFGKTAELIGEYLSKGSPVMFEARLKLDKWQDKKTNENRYKLKLIIDKLHFLGGKGGGGQGGGGGRRDEYSEPVGDRQEPTAAGGDGLDQVPF